MRGRCSMRWPQTANDGTIPWLLSSGTRLTHGRSAEPAKVITFTQIRGVAQPGSAPALGAGSRRFKSSHPDHSYLTGRPTARGLGEQGVRISDCYDPGT